MNDNLTENENDLIDKLLYDNSVDVSDWEAGFLESIANQEYPLTIKQKDKLEEVYEKYYS